MYYKNFLSPCKIGNLELKNRCVMTAAGTLYAKNYEATQRTINYYARRAQGSCAMVIVEMTCIHPSTSGPDYLCIDDDKYIPSLSKLAKGIQDAGGKACVQLYHGGRQFPPHTKDASGETVYSQPWSSSDIPSDVWKMVPHIVTIDEIKEIVKSYGSAAVRAKKAGFDAIELHFAHGYFVDQFLNPYSNTRTDEYGGSFENRTRLALEVIAEVREQVGRDYPVLVRITGNSQVPNGNTVDENIKIAQLFEEAGVDCLNVTQGSYQGDSIAYTCPPFTLPHGVHVGVAAEIKKNVGIPVLVAGRINTPEMADEIIASGKADFIGMIRPLLADPDFVNKADAGKSDEIIKCLGCNMGCVAGVYVHGYVSCVLNPESGREGEVIIEPAPVRKNVIVIGGGPAGLEAARVAALRGHNVTLFEKSDRLGGQFYIAGFAPNKENFTESAIQMGHRAYKAGVDIKLCTVPTLEKIQALNPDEIIIATGSKPFIPNIPGVDGKHVYEARSIMGSNKYVPEDNIVVIGGGMVGLETAEILHAQGKKVFIVEMMDQVGKDLAMHVVPYIRHFLDDNKVPVYLNSKCVNIGDNYIEVEKDGKREKIQCGAVVIAVGAKSNTEVENLVKETGKEYHIIGDAKTPGQVMPAILAGNEIGRRIW